MCKSRKVGGSLVPRIILAMCLHLRMLKCLFVEIYNSPAITQIFMLHCSFQNLWKLGGNFSTVFQENVCTSVCMCNREIEGEGAM